MRKIGKKVGCILAFVTVLAGSTAVLASDIAQAERERNLQVVEDFLTHPDIADAMTSKHGKSIKRLMKKVNKLDDRQLADLAADTHSLIQLGAESGTQRIESKTAENISDRWLKLGYLAVIMPLLLLLLIF